VCASGLKSSPTPLLWENWYRRVARYIAFCLDGSVVFTLSLANISRCWRSDDERARPFKQVGEQYLIYVVFFVTARKVFFM